MSWHLLIHWLDDLRHEGASTFAWEAVKSNLGAWPWQAALTGIGAYALWPRLRRAVDAWVRGHLDRQHDALKATLAEHHQAMKDHVASEIQKLE